MTTLNVNKYNEVNVEPKVGSLVHLDANRFPNRLLPGDDYVDEGFPGCEFRYPNPVRGWEEKHAIACNVVVTGRTTQRRGGENWVRVRIEWVGDCEASTFTTGWMMVE
jgi:hypothetical protein